MKTRKLINKNIIISNLKSLGINKGDTLFIRADLSKIGRLEEKNKKIYVEAILEAIGEEGTLVGLSFTKDFLIKPNKDYIFDGSNSSYVGSFSNIMLSHEKSIRSSHPTNSYVAIGKNAEFITKNHDETSGAYDPIRKIIELNSKMLLIGCADSSPGFTTTHLAEIDLGLHKRIIFPFFNKVFYRKNNKVKLFKRKDLGGCSSSYKKLYSEYISNEILFSGYIGNAYTLLTSAKDAYQIDYKIGLSNNKFNICESDNCFMCNARRWDRVYKQPSYWLRFIVYALKNKKVMKR